MKKNSVGLSYLEIFDGLNKHNIKYIICGGLALNLHGIPRMTYDIDLLIRLDKRNLNNFFALMDKWHFKPQVSVEITDLLDNKKLDKLKKEKNLVAISFCNFKWAISEIDVLVGTKLNYEKIVKSVVYKKIGKIKLPIVSISDLIKMKKDTFREQDNLDIKYLKELEKNKYEKKKKKL